MRSFLFFLTVAFLLNPFWTSSTAGPLKRPLSFEHLTQKEGLSSNMVLSIGVQGDEVWLGTYEGGATLYNRAKKSFKHFTTKGEPTIKVDDWESIRWKNHLAYNHVSVITLDSNRIWFGTYFYGFGGGGISYYRPQKNPQWKTFSTNEGRAKKVNAIAVDGESLWVGSEKGISLFDKTTESWKQFFSTRDGLSGNFVNSILIEPEAVWMATSGGISRLQTLYCHHFNPDPQGDYREDASCLRGPFPRDDPRKLLLRMGLSHGSHSTPLHRRETAHSDRGCPYR